jgi:hypothetical protein
MKTETKTMQKVINVYNHLRINFSNKKFRFNDVEKFLVDRDIHGMTFYYFVYANVITKLERGVYQINDSFYNTTPKNIYLKGVSHLIDLRKKREIVLSGNLEKSYKTIIKKSNVGINESQAISYLKGLGYKVMKPIQQYEEI